MEVDGVDDGAGDLVGAADRRAGGARQAEAPGELHGRLPGGGSLRDRHRQRGIGDAWCHKGFAEGDTDDDDGGGEPSGGDPEVEA